MGDFIQFVFTLVPNLIHLFDYILFIKIFLVADSGFDGVDGHLVALHLPVHHGCSRLDRQTGRIGKNQLLDRIV